MVTDKHYNTGHATHVILIEKHPFYLRYYAV